MFVLQVGASDAREHRRWCPLSRLPYDCWLRIVGLLQEKDLFSFQTACSCARDITNIRFDKELREYRFEYDHFAPHVTPLARCHALDFANVMSIVTRHHLQHVVSLSLDMQSACDMQIQDNFFLLLSAHCANVKKLSLINASVSLWSEERQAWLLALESLSVHWKRCSYLAKAPRMT